MTNNRIIWILLFFTILLMVILRIQNTQLITASAPLGILSLEFSTTASQVENIRTEWVGSIRQSFYINTLLDFFYLLFYGLFLFFTSTYFSMLRPQSAKVGRYAATAGLVAAGLDATENLLMLFSISYGGTNIVAVATATMASIKFLLAAFSLLYIIVSAVSNTVARIGR